jgi:hypothetical protein
LNTSIEQEGQIMVDFQLPLPGLSRDFNELTKQEMDFIAYFSATDMDSISPVVDCYAGIGPKGYNVFLILARIIKIKERILSDRQLAEVLRKNDLYRFVTNDIQPAHNTFNTLRKRLGPEGFVKSTSDSFSRPIPWVCWSLRFQICRSIGRRESSWLPIPHS